MTRLQPTLFDGERMLYHVGVSGGKDSDALLLWSVHKSGIPRKQLRVTFCDTGNEDVETYRHIEMLDEKVVRPAGIIGGLETLIPPLQFFPLALKKRRFPSRKAQFCTSELKIKPTRIWLRQQWDAGFETVVLNGKRRGESPARKKAMKDTPLRAFSDFWGCEEMTPLRDWTWPDVVAIHREYSIPLNPLYAMGAHRVGCWPCINCGKTEIRLVAKHRPEKIQQIADWEKSIRVGEAVTFFEPTIAPIQYRTSAVKTNSGETVMVSPIEQVVRWAQTTRGGKQLRLELDEPVVCHLGYHGCE